ncbi:helix-turn-helix domain-containing protein [Kribbella sp.]|uniref:TetR/AcrR family transcriptional regulator n=1 Tax=Kribbella sp. TaxID=1871183 RepID=UPI002D6ECBF8|nr:helix-turn-helix domain-containing protein [Kribbella sp.]HZX07257.1 helix-turn-helix domain-containing protein [Kribbella sp.]
MQHATISRDTKTEIRRATAQLFSAQRYDQTSPREIAEQTGITKASPYHYSSKEEPPHAILLDAASAVLSQRGTVQAEDTGGTRWFAAGRAVSS